jgi:hypothetical protein
MTLAIGALKKYLFLAYQNAMTIIQHIPMCYSTCQNVDIVSLKNVPYVDKWNHIDS